MRIFDKWPWTNIHELNLDWILENMRKLLSAMDELSRRVLPPGGTNGQVLAKNSAEDFDVHWVYQQGGGGSGRDVPEGGENGQVLTADGANGYDWANLPEPREVPSTSGANAGDVLTVDGQGDYDWQAPPSGGVDASQATDGQVLTANGEGGYGFEELPTHRQVPTGGTNGQVLTAGADDSYAWANPPSPSTGREVPDATGEPAGKVLTTDGADGYGWENPDEPREVPDPALGNVGDELTIVSAGQYGWEAHRHVPSASQANDGDVLTADGSGGYAWETPAGSGAGAAVGLGKLYGFRLYYRAAGSTHTITSQQIYDSIFSEQTYGEIEFFMEHREDGQSHRRYNPIPVKAYLAGGAGQSFDLYCMDTTDNSIIKLGRLTTGWGSSGWSFTFESGVGPSASLSDTIFAKWVCSTNNRSFVNETP